MISARKLSSNTPLKFRPRIGMFIVQYGFIVEKLLTTYSIPTGGRAKSTQIENLLQKLKTRYTNDPKLFQLDCQVCMTRE